MAGPSSNPGSDEGRQTGEMPPPSAATGQGSPEEHSGLIDIKTMARSTKNRVTARLSSESDVEEALLAASRPSALRDVVLPEPGVERTIATGTASMPAVAAGAGTGVEAVARSRWMWLAVAGLAVLAAGLGALLVMAGGAGVRPAVPAGAGGAAAAGEASGGSEPGAVIADQRAADRVPPAAEHAAAAVAEQPAGAERSQGARIHRDAAGAKAGSEARPTLRGRAQAGRVDTSDRERVATGARATTSREPKAAAKAVEPLPGADLDALLDRASGSDSKPEKGAQVSARAEASATAKPAKTSLTRGDITQGMAAVRGAALDCYSRYQQPGTVQVKLTIAPNGAVTTASAVDGTFRGTDTGRCVAEAVAKASFPAWNGRPMTVTYPFLLQ
jgi:hypothetical protein